ncbi:protein of unknown function [Tenacibaculum sp. 190130A14a]|uniref:Lipocalin-like domain-containing protein n=1 Tax=Tenacibaculum polynesiense TaxID=3137857 RepID=A0ABP1ESD4_9FLAO
MKLATISCVLIIVLNSCITQKNISVKDIAGSWSLVSDFNGEMRLKKKLFNNTTFFNFEEDGTVVLKNKEKRKLEDFKKESGKQIVRCYFDLFSSVYKERIGNWKIDTDTLFIDLKSKETLTFEITYLDSKFLDLSILK